MHKLDIVGLTKRYYVERDGRQVLGLSSYASTRHRSSSNGTIMWHRIRGTDTERRTIIAPSTRITTPACTSGSESGISYPALAFSVG